MYIAQFIILTPPWIPCFCALLWACVFSLCTLRCNQRLWVDHVGHTYVGIGLILLSFYFHMLAFVATLAAILGVM